MKSNVTVEAGLRLEILPAERRTKAASTLFNPALYNKSRESSYSLGTGNYHNGFQLASTGAIPKGVLGSPVSFGCRTLTSHGILAVRATGDSRRCWSLLQSCSRQLRLLTPAGRCRIRIAPPQVVVSFAEIWEQSIRLR